jgi:hypothetical protein
MGAVLCVCETPRTVAQTEANARVIETIGKIAWRAAN